LAKNLVAAFIKSNQFNSSTFVVDFYMQASALCWAAIALGKIAHEEAFASCPAIGSAIAYAAHNAVNAGLQNLRSNCKFLSDFP